MTAGQKENAMTVTLPKRCLFEDPASLAAPQPAAKRLRVLTPITEQLASSCHIQQAAAGPELGAAQQQQHTAKKRVRQDSADSNQPSWPPAGNKRGKRANGRSTSATASPNSAAAALEALLTCEGLEKDPDLETEVAYISSRQQQQQLDTAREGSNSSSPTGRAARPDQLGHDSGVVQDAARNGRDKKRDQDQHPRHNRGSTSSSARDQERSQPHQQQHNRRASSSREHQAAAGHEPAAAFSPRPAAAGPPQNSDAAADKEWQRLFAVLSISGQPRQAGEAREQPGGQGQPATGPVVQEAPSTPARVEGGTSSSCDATPSRVSFLAGEFSRVQQRQRSEPPAADLMATAAPFGAFGTMDMGC